MKKYFLYLLVAYSCCNASAQKNHFEVSDSLILKSYHYYNQQIIANHQDTISSLLYAKAWITKAKKEHNFKQLAHAFKAMLHRVPKEQQFAYADSTLASAIKTLDDVEIGSAYLTKGLLYYDRFEHEKALENYIVANSYISKTKDRYLMHKVKYAMAQTKYFLGYYDDAITLFRECVSYFRDENEIGYINSLHALGLSYSRAGKFDLSSETNTMGMQAMLESENFKLKPYVTQSEGVNQYFKKKYRLAIKMLNESLVQIGQNGDTANEAVGHFYIAKSYYGLGLQDKAMPYLKMVDYAFEKLGYLRPDLRENYEILIRHYKAEHDGIKQLIYIEKLSRLDSILQHKNTYLVGKIVKEYDTKKLMQEKDDIEREKLVQSIAAITVIATLLTLVTYLIYRHYENKKRYVHFENIMRNPGGFDRVKITNDIPPELKLKLKPEVEKAILANLKTFENTFQYLEKDMNLNKMAQRLKTNTKYASNILMVYREKRIIEYISDLKIDYIVEKLKSEKKYRNYTNEALGEISGFGSTQIFTKTFKSRTGMPPTWFIQELEKADLNDSSDQV